MADKVAVYPPFFFGIGMNYEDYKDVEIAEWLAVVAIFYVAIAYINGYYKSQFYNGQIIRYGSYRRWLTRHFISLTITCILIAACDYAVFTSGNELRLCFVMVLSMALNFIFKAVFIFFVSNQKIAIYGLVYL